MGCDPTFAWESIVEPLLAWYAREARILPWRENTDAYRVWVSEIMLQQTRVEAALPYYRRFLEKLPDLRSLAEAPEPVLLKLWEGLGYYSRARNLQKAARLICDKYDGRFPDRYEDVLSLPGVGSYTAGAILSIAFEQPRAAVDGNVLRVASRLTECGRDVGDLKWRAEIAQRLEAVYPTGRCGAFTQSLMELGALVCLPNAAPLCGGCPLAGLCGACRSGSQTAYPVRREKAARKRQELAVLLLCCGPLTAVCRRPDSGLLAGMWEFPNVEGNLTADDLREWLSGQGLSAGTPRRVGSYLHTFTHLQWQMTGWRVECAETTGVFEWVDRQTLRENCALPSAFRWLADCLDVPTAQT